MKRLIDILMSLVCLILLLPVLICIYIIIRISDGSPVIFRQERPGYKAYPFTLYKFRTMTNDVGDSGILNSDEARLTRVGRVLRKTSLDEAPQLINVIKGEMSLVGPRPLLMEYIPLYNNRQSRRHDVKPGITGWAQVNGRNTISWEDKFDLDVWYVDNQSFFLDMKIMWLTLLRIIRKNDISYIGHATMPKFTGSKDANNE